MKKWILTSSDPCPSCLAAADQVHPIEVWEAAGFLPGSSNLYCGFNCHCHFEDTDEPEHGNLSDIPRKGAEHLQNHDHVKLSSQAQLTESGQFEILAITAGQGNGWLFPAATLQASLPLWDKAESFIDHSQFGRSLKDLAGICTDPTWDDNYKGIKLKLKPVGPSAQMLTEIGKQMLNESPHPRIGFSADVLFTAQGKTVTQIMRVYSVDLVFDPARGGEFLRTLQSKGFIMPDPVDDSQALRLEMSANLLETSLAAAHLPPALTDLVRARFSGQIFKPEDLNTAIEEHRNALSTLTANSTVQGPRISSMFDSGDQLQASAFDLLGVDRPPELKELKTAKLSGIRELYTGMTGDFDFHGGFDQARAQFTNTTATLPGVLKTHSTSSSSSIGIS
mgnify:CR=1 FL=1